MANRNEQGKMSREEAGRLGGQGRAEKHSHEELSQQSKQAAKTVENEQPGFHSNIGKEGGSKGGKASGISDEEE